MEEPELILGAAHSDVEASASSFRRQRADSRVGRGDHGQEHHIALVALEGVGVAADEVAALHLLGTEPLSRRRSMNRAWASPSRLMTPMVAPL